MNSYKTYFNTGVSRVLLITLTLLYWGCESKKFKQIVTWNLNRVYQVNIPDGQTVEGTWRIDRSDLVSISGLPDDAVVTEAHIEKIGIKLAEGDASTASSLKIGGFFRKPTGKVTVWPDTNFPVNFATIKLINSTVGKNIEEIAGKLVQILKDPNSQEWITLDVSMTPSGTFIGNVELIVWATLEYEYCQDVPPLFNDGGEDCDL